ncbi:hypothetical protein [Streptococcus chenjunshii]|nr:hypothetical protein [Streptococcus chenjunshii]
MAAWFEKEKMMKNTTKFYKTYQSALEGAGHKDAVKQSHGIYGGSLMYVFDDEQTKEFVTLLKNKKGWRVLSCRKYYGRTGVGPGGFDIKE